LIRGGTGSRSESEEMPVQLPDRLEAGTPNGPGIAGLGAACRWLAGRGVEAVAEHEGQLVRRLADSLQSISGVVLHCWSDDAPHTGLLSFTVAGRDNGELAAALDREHRICLRAGLHCAPSAHRRIGTFPDGTLRAGIGPFNTEAEADALVGALRVLSSR
jgi:selenocysteine lyase/cysteine desulfurase